jgi:hypothetical protein
VDALDGYLVKKTTIAIVKRAIVEIKTLWLQRAINPIMFNSNKFKWCSGCATAEWLPVMGAALYIST